MKLLILLLILVTIPLVVAIPEIPHQFYGTISNSNGPIQSGTLTAKLCNKEFSTQIENGNYGIKEPLLVYREDCSNINVEFYISTNKIYTYQYEAGAYTKLDFNVPIFTTASDDNSGNGGNGDSSDNDPGSSDVKSKMYPVIQIDNNVVPNEDQEENQLSDKTIESEQTSSQGNLLSNLKEIISYPFKTKNKLLIGSFVGLLIFCIILYGIRRKL